MTISVNKTQHTSQEIDNMSFDESLGVKLVEIIGADGVLKNPATEAKQDAQTVELQEIITQLETRLGDLNNVLRMLLVSIVNPPYIDKSANAIRNQVQSGTVTTVTNLTNFGTQGADVLYRINSINAWANNDRNLIS